MIANVSDFKLDSVSKLNGYTEYTLSFIKPSGFLGGYEVYYSFDGAEFYFGAFRPDLDLQLYGRALTSDFTSTIDGRTIFTFTILDSDMIPGSAINIRIRALSIYKEYSEFSRSVVTYSYPSQPTTDLFSNNLKVVAKQEGVTLMWNNLDFTSYSNKDVADITISKNIMQELPIQTYSNNIVYNSTIAVGDLICVYDYVNKSIWYGAATAPGQLDLSSTLVSEYSHVYTLESPPFFYNLKMYRPSPQSIVISKSAVTKVSGSELTYFDPTIPYDNIVLYTVTYSMPDESISTSISLPLQFTDLSATTPTWRPLEKSNTAILSSTTWKKLKKVLIDKNYYDQNYWAIPYAETQKYSLIGFVGIADCLVDIFVNDTLHTTTSTGEYGEFEFLYKFPKTTTVIKYQARTKNNFYFSTFSIPISVRTYHLYSYFAALSTEYNKLRQKQFLNKDKISIDSCDSTAFADIYAPLVGYSRYATESISDYRGFVRETYRIYNNIAYEKSLSDLISLFTSNVSDIDSVDLKMSAEFEESQTLSINYISCLYADINMPRLKYRYYVSAFKADSLNNKQETSPAIIDVDTRWWPTIGDYRGYNVLTWSRVSGADHYIIYRGQYSSDGVITEDDMVKLIETTQTMFVDTGVSYPSSNERPVLYNASVMETPANLKNTSHLLLGSYENLLKKPYYFTIFIYMKGDTVLPQYLIDRFNYILKTITPAEMFYHVIISNNSSVSVYNKRGIKVN